MSKKRIAIVLIIAAVILLAFVIFSVAACLPQDGPWIGVITQYHPPFYGHGLLMILAGIAAAILFLIGIILLVLDRR
ncbi:MAG: hypothetical protein IJJ80_06085 [Clostridia bacterium]|nr:hypothetical protein [Clostridia bacterium]